MNAGLDPWLSGTLHEVKNLLNELSWRLESHGGLASEQALALRCAQRLSTLLLLQRQRAGQLHPGIEACSPGDLLEDLAADYRPLFPSLRIEVVADAEAPPAFFDLALLRLVLADVLHNACRHAVQRVVLEVAGAEGGVCLQISDDGPGYPAAQLHNPGQAPAALHGDGTGLGLHLAATVAALHTRDGRPGRIELANNDGARFRLYLP